MIQGLEDTIVAPATSLVGNTLGIIRVSGNKSLAICEKIFQGKRKITEQQKNTVLHGYIKAEDTIVDEVVVNVYIKPNSYTGEDMVEIFCHGNPTIMKEIIKLLLKNKARKARPGEFTQRAVFNGKMDILQAEAVQGLYKIHSISQMKSLAKQLKGELSKTLHSLIAKIEELLVKVEAALEFPDDVEIPPSEIKSEIEKITHEVKSIISKTERGRFIFQGVDIPIIGAPNVGKSTLFNALLNEDRAIVTETPGTTRDFISETVIIKGYPIKFYDTAGIRVTNDKIEIIGVQKTSKIIENSNILIVVLDITRGFTEDDKKVLEISQGKKQIIVWNKLDLKRDAKVEGIKIAAKYKEGIEKIYEVILSYLQNGKDSILMSDIELENLKAAALSLSKILHNPYLDVIAEGLKNALHSLSYFEPQNLSDAILNQIFSKFCIGK